MDFFTQKDDAEARSRAFYRAFALAVALAVTVFYFVVTVCLMLLFGKLSGLAELGLVEGMISQLPKSIYGSPPKVLSLRPFLIISILISVFILIIAWFKTRVIKEGGGAYIAEALGGVLIQEPHNFNEKQLLNVVEEMAVAAGLPRPRVYILPHELAINAVTAGLDHDDAVIAVTHGALHLLNREELQGVVAHEFAHILNDDCALNLTMAGWLYGLLIFSVQGKDMLNTAVDDMMVPDAGGRVGLMFYFGLVLALVGLILWIGGWLGKLAAEILQAAFSRQREYLADAFAVQFTRNPEGLAGALKKIAGLSQQGIIKSGQALMVNSFFIVSPNRATGGEQVESIDSVSMADVPRAIWDKALPFRQPWRQSHPPLEERILALEPHWDGEVPEIDRSLLVSYHRKLRLSKSADAPAPQSARKLLDRVAQVTTGNSAPLILAFLAAGAGPRLASGFWTPDSLEAEAAGRSLNQARTLFTEIPEKLRVAVDDPTQVAGLVAAVFIHEENGPAEPQLGEIRRFLGNETADRAVEFNALLSDRFRLPVLSLVSPTLKTLSPPDRQKLAQAIKGLVAVDGRLGLFELAACQVLKKPLGVNFFGSAPREVSAVNFLGGLQEDTVMLLSALAYFCSPNEDEAGRALAAGMAHFNQWPPFEILPRKHVTSGELARALDRLSHVPEKIKHKLILAAVSASLHNHKISDKGYQLLRALAAALDIPIPLANVNMSASVE